MKSRALGIGSLLLVVSGCSLLGDTTSPSRHAPVPMSRLALAVELGEDPSFAGDLVAFDLVLTNRDSKPITLSFSSTCQLLYEVRDALGRRVSEDFACGAMGSSLTLDPGESKRQPAGWLSSRYDLRSRTYVPLAPGVYSIRGYVSEHPEYRSAERAVALLRREVSGS